MNNSYMKGKAESKKIYLYGAGVNGIEVCNFLGYNQILAVIDSDPLMQGKKYVYDLPVISLEEYLQDDNNFSIVVTPYRNDSIVKCLDEKNIHNFYLAPWMQNFFDSMEEAIDLLRLYKYSNVYLLDSDNPFLQNLESCLRKRKIKVSYMNNYENHLCTDNCCMICLGTELDLSEYNKYPGNKISLTEAYMKMHRFKNNSLSELKDKFDGEKCFIIGNGPSLTMSDLNLIHQKDIFSFGVNFIYKCFKDTSWRPSAYVFVDNGMLLFEEFIKLAPNIAKFKFARHNSRIRLSQELSSFYEFGGLLQTEDKLGFSFDITEGVYNGFSVVYDVLQLAVYMGFKEIYFLGVDLSNGRGADEHFYGNEYLGDNFATTDSHLDKTAHLIGEASGLLHEHGIKLYNASRGGMLNSISRVDFDTVIQEITL